METKFKEFILENLDDPIEVLISENCKPFLQEMKKCKNLFYRGISYVINDIEELEILEKRVPRDTPKKIHNKLNTLSNKKFGWKIRNGIFVSTDKLECSKYHNSPGDDCPDSYGSTNIFLPIGEYKYVWNDRVKDLTEQINDDSMARFDDWINWEDSKIPLDKQKEKYIKDLETYLNKIVNGYKTDNFQDANFQEVSFMCDKYYLVNSKHYSIIKYLIQNS